MENCRDTIDPQKFSRVIAVNFLRYGQPRRYADSVYEAEITFTGKDVSIRPGVVVVCGCDPPEGKVKEFVGILVAKFVEPRQHLMPYLEELRVLRKGPGFTTWLARVVEPYTY